jgi:hypothetical protein
VAIPYFLLAFNINYIQNDEYIHYQVTKSLITGKFQLEQYLAPTFITQAFLGGIFSLFFGTTHLPILTAILAVASSTIFAFICLKFIKCSVTSAVLLALFLLVNPIYLYSSFGYMTEIYFMFFFFTALYFFYSYEYSGEVKNLILFNIFAILLFFVKQFGIVVIIATSAYFLIKKKYKTGLTQGLVSGVVYLFYLLIFPRTDQMKSISISTDNISRQDAFTSLIFVILIYISLFSIPLILSASVKFIKNRKESVVFLLLAISLFFLLNKFLKPEEISHTSTDITGKINYKYSSPAFPYLGNTFGRLGFFPDNLDGNKYHYPGYFDLFKALELAGKISASLFLALIIMQASNMRNFSFELIYTFLSVCLLLVTPKIYDRYLISLIPMAFLYLLKLQHNTRIINWLLIPFILFWTFIGHQFLMDFYLVNKYVWNKSLELVEKGTSPNLIRADNSWLHLYPNSEKKWKYQFEYMSDKQIEVRKKRVETLEKHSIEFLGNFYIQPFVYLTKTKD